MKIIHSILIVLLIFSACKQVSENLNEKAALPENFQFEKMGLKAINSIINPQLATTSILYGNNNALKSSVNPELSVKGEKVLVLATWQQHDDPRWFGAKSPSDFLMLEIVKTNDDFKETDKISYEIMKGKNAKSNVEPEMSQQKRIQFITSIEPTVMP